MQFFEDSGWHVVEAKYGRRLQAAFDRTGRRGAAAAHRRDVERGVPEPLRPPRRRAAPAVPRPMPTPAVKALLDDVPDDELAPLVQNLGGHDLGLLIDCLPGVRRRHRPAEHRVRLHREGLGAAHRRRPAEPRRAPVPGPDRRAPRRGGPDGGDRVGPLRTRLATPACVCARVGGEVNNVPVPPRPRLAVPAERRRRRVSKPVSTPGDVRPPAHRPGERPGGGSPARHHVARRLGVHEPRRLDQQDGRVRRRRATRLPRRGPPAALAAGPCRPPHRARDQRDEPLPAARPARARPRAARRGAAADRHGLRPVRLPWPGRLPLRHLQRRPVHRRRHAVGHHAGARRRRPPVHDHRLDRPRAARRHVRRAGLRHRPRLAAVRRAATAAGSRRRLALPPALHPPDRPAPFEAVRGAARGRAAPGRRPGRRLPPRASRRRSAATTSCSRRRAPCCPRCVAAADRARPPKA